MFINDLPDNIISRTRLFADDRILDRQAVSDNSQNLLLEDMDMLAPWEKTLGINNDVTSAKM